MFTKRRLLLSFLIGSLTLVTLIGNGGRVEAGKQPCKTCKEFVVSFEKRFKETEKSNYAGGDTSWEEENLGSYANSEVRLVEILDGVCRHSDYDCHRILENNEEDLEIWWFKLRHKEGKGDLKQWLCYSHLDVCCPNNTFGPTCEECPGGVTSPCGGRGSCEGSEEKDGSGVCSCQRGYDGSMCQQCAKGYFNDTDTDEDRLTCEACDRACKDSCSGAGPDMCDECASGYELSDDDTCKDIDECKDEDICREGTYCLNLQGSHKCNKCDKACLKVCNGPGPAQCAECAKGYTRDSAGMCKDDDECEDGLTCKAGTYCENQPGSFICKACHISCKLECLGPGAGGCAECRDGYTMEDKTCTDVDECSEESNPCDLEMEVCQNLIGSYVCKCREGLVKSTDGGCIPMEELPPEVKPKKPKRKKKSKKGGKTKELPKKKEREGEEEVLREGGGEPVLPSGSTSEQDLVNGHEPVAAENSESYREEVVLEPVAVKNLDDLTQTAEAKGDAAESLDSTNVGADLTTSTDEDIAAKEEEGYNEPTSEPTSNDQDTITSAQEAAAVNTSQQDNTGEDVTGQNERQGVLNDVKTTSGQNQEKSEKSHEEL